MSRPIIIAEIFHSIQAEGGRAGQASVFIRTAGCPVDCWFCDTDWEHGTPLSVDQIISAIGDYSARWIVLTGGEPAAQPAVADLIERLHQLGYRVAIETSGIRDITAWGLDWITVSPKESFVDRAGRPTPPTLPAMILAATELKFIVAEGVIPPMTLPPDPETPVWLQPEYGEMERNVAAIMAFILEQGHTRFRLSLQTHKWIGADHSQPRPELLPRPTDEIVRRREGGQLTESRS